MNIQPNAFALGQLNTSTVPLSGGQQTLPVDNAGRLPSLNPGGSPATPFLNVNSSVPAPALWRGVSDSFTPSFSQAFTRDSAEGVAMWGSREWLGKTIDKATAPVSQRLQAMKTHGAGSLASPVTVMSNPFKTYSQLLYLPSNPTRNMTFSDLSSPSGYIDKVKNNFSKLANRAKLQIKGERSFLPRNFTAGDYVRGTVLDANIKPIKDLVRGENIGSGLARLAGFGFMGFDIFKTAKATYQVEQAKQDESLSGRLAVYAKTAKVAALQSMKNLISWEIAGIGMAIGSKVLPGFRALPLGGIVLGVAGATMAKKGMDKIIPTQAESSETHPEIDLKA